jgi:cephalosporin-C deacetylase
MAQFDLPLDQLRAYRPARDEPADFDAFWASTLAASRAKRVAPVVADVETGLETIAAADVTFSGFDGQPIKAWLLWPAGRTGPLPTMVEYIGYGGGRGQPYEWLLWASAGYAHLVMDTRGQGGTWQGGDTSDIDDSGTGSQAPGVMSRGILGPATYYYRRLMTDAVLAIDAARDIPIVDPDRIVVIGASQGGGLALTVAGLAEGLAGAVVDVPFLTHFRRALEVTDEHPYGELRLYLRTHRREEEQVFRTLSYFDGRSFAARAMVPAMFSVGLEDEITPPSTVFAAYNEYAGPKEIRVWPFSGHEAPEHEHTAERLAFAARRLR